MQMKIDQIIDEFLGEHKEWTGTPSALFTEIMDRFGMEQLPVTRASALSRTLNYHSTKLLDRGISVEHGRIGVERCITLRREHPSVELVRCPLCKRVVLKIIKNPEST